jgi:hypothetical protein
MKYDIIQNINRQERLMDRKARLAYISIHTHYLGKIWKRRCEVLLYQFF